MPCYGCKAGFFTLSLWGWVWMQPFLLSFSHKEEATTSCKRGGPVEAKLRRKEGRKEEPCFAKIRTLGNRGQHCAVFAQQSGLATASVGQGVCDVASCATNALFWRIFRGFKGPEKCTFNQIRPNHRGCRHKPSGGIFARPAPLA